MKNILNQFYFDAKLCHISVINTVCIVLPRMLLSAIIIMVLQLVNIVDNCHDNKLIFDYHS